MSVSGRTASNRDDDGASRGEGQADSGERPSRSAAERVTLAAVLVILGMLVAALMWSSLQPGEDEAAFVVSIDEGAIEVREGHFYVPLHVENTGKATGEDVIVRASIMEGNVVVEESELTFTFIAGGEAEDGVAVFKADPREAEVEAGVVSYLEP